MARGEGERYADYILSDEANRRSSVQMTPQQAAVLARSAAMYPEVPAGTHVAASQMSNGDTVLDQANTAAMRAAPPKPKRKKSLWQKATGVAGEAVGRSFEGVGMAADFLTPKPVENVLKPIGNVVQPTVRAGAAILATPLQAAVGTGRELYGLGTGQTKWEGFNDFGNDIAEQTTLGQVFKKWGLPGTGGGEFNPNADIDLGSGFFPSQESAIEKQRVAKERSTGMIGNSAWTPGRWLAVDGLHLDQGSAAYSVMSGVGDGLIAWFGDPMNLALGKASEAARATRLGTEIVGEAKVLKAAEKATPEWRAIVDEAMGLVPGTYDAPRDSVLASNAAKWLYGDEGRRAVGRMKDIKSTTQLWEDTGMKLPLALAHQIAKSDDEVEIANALVSALTSSVRDLPSLGRRRGLGVADRFVKNRQAVGRLFNMVPDTRIEWDDVEGSFRNLRNAAANVGIHGEDRAKLLDQWAEAFTSPLEKRQARYNATKLWGDTLNAQLKSQGVPDAIADAASSWTKKLDQINQYDVDDWGRGISFADDSGTGPFLVSQLLETGMYLYDPKAVRQLRELTATKAMKFIARRPEWRGAVSFAAGLQSDIWKPMQLIGPKYLAKILPEEYGRVALGGAIKGPLGWLHTVFGDQYGVDATGGAFKSLAERAESLVSEKNAYDDILFTTKDPAAKAEATKALKEIDDELAALNEEIGGHATDFYSEGMNRKYSKKAGVDYGSNQLYEEGRISGNDRAMRDRYDSMLRQQVRRGNMQQVSAEQDIDRWAMGQGQSILGLHGDEIARRVANGGLFESDYAALAAQADDVIEEAVPRVASAAYEGGPALYHGSANRLPPVLDRYGVGRSADNLFGPGLYTTDAEDIARTYTVKGRGSAPTVHSIKWNGDRPPVTMDLDQPAHGALKDAMSRALAPFDDGTFDPDAEAFAAVRGALDGNGSGADLISKFRRMAGSAQMPRSEIDDIMHEVADALEASGFDALVHQGGLRAGQGQRLHGVTIFLDPAKVSATEMGAAQRVRSMGGGTGQFRQGLDGIVDWLNMGEGRKWRDSMEEYALSRNPNYQGAVARDMVDIAADSILYRTGNDPLLLSAIATGQIGGEKIIGQVGAVTGNIPSEDVLKRLKDVWNNGNPDISEKAAFLPSEISAAGAKSRDLERAMDVKDTMTRWFFQSVYGKSSDKLNRSPAFRSYYWRRVEELIPHMDAQTAREMLDEAAGTIPKRQYASMEKKLLKANGDLDREAVNQLAGHAALEDTTDLLFDASSRTQLFDTLRVVMPFGEAWREIVTSYSRLIRQNPRALRRFQQTINGLRGAGVMYKNEYGEESVSIPLSGPLVGLITGGESKASMSMSAKSLSIGTSVIPGIGPALSGPIYHFIPDKPGTEWIRDTLFPYGKPQALDAIPAPAWAKKLFESTGWVDGRTAFSTQNQVMNQLYARDPDKYANEPEVLIADAKAVSQGVLMARGIAQAFSPGAPSVRYTAETKDGDVAAAKLSDEFRKMQLSEDEGGEGLDYNEAVAAFLDKYGPGSALYIVGNTEAKVKGLDASSEFTNFERENGWLFTSHNEIAGYFGPHGGEFDYTTYTRQLEAGYRRQLTPDERLAAANQVIGNMMVRNEEEILEAEKPKAEWTSVETGYMKWYKSNLENELFGYTQYDAYDVNSVQRQMDDLFQAAGDQRLEDNATAQAVLDYQKERALVFEKMAADGMTGIGSKQATVYRSYLEWKGAKMAEETPGFQTVWDRLLSREVEATDE